MYLVKEKMILAAVVIIALIFGASKVLAIPAWSRKYGTTCNTCHRPNIPRLNPDGHRFRKMGFRFADDLNKQPDYKEIGQYLSVRGRGRYRHQDNDTEKTVSRFEWHDATLFYAGPVTPSLTAFFEAEWEDTDDIVLNAYISWFHGTQDNYCTIRGGQFHTLTRVGWAGFDRPSGISTPKPLSTRLTTSAIPFSISQDQKGIDFAWGPNRDVRFIGQVLNGINYAGSGNSGSADDDTDKDILLAYEHMLDEKGSGLTVMGYRGVWHQNPANTVGGVPLRDDPDWNEFSFYRLAVTGSYLMDICRSGLTEIQGGMVLSRDNVPDNYPAGGADINGQAYFLELQQYCEKGSVFIRSDMINLDTDIHDWELTYTAGGARMINEYLQLSMEIFYTDDKRLSNNSGLSGNDEVGLLAEAMLNF